MQLTRNMVIIISQSQTLSSGEDNTFESRINLATRWLSKNGNNFRLKRKLARRDEDGCTFDSSLDETESRRCRSPVIRPPPAAIPNVPPTGGDCIALLLNERAWSWALISRRNRRVCIKAGMVEITNCYKGHFLLHITNKQLLTSPLYNTIQK